MSDNIDMARRFHDVYEHLAPEFGYETRPETREFDPDSPNGRLMIAVCREVTSDIEGAFKSGCSAGYSRAMTGDEYMPSHKDADFQTWKRVHDGQSHG